MELLNVISIAVTWFALGFIVRGHLERNRRAEAQEPQR